MQHVDSMPQTELLFVKLQLFQHSLLMILEDSLFKHIAIQIYGINWIKRGHVIFYVSFLHICYTHNSFVRIHIIFTLKCVNYLEFHILHQSYQLSYRFPLQYDSRASLVPVPRGTGTQPN